MRIAIVTETWAPEVNGVALTVQGLARGLRKLGHSVEIVRPRRADGDAAQHRDGFDELLVRGAALPRYPGLRFGLPAQAQLVRHWRQRMPDALYVATEGPLGHSALAAARRLGVPASTGFHTRFDDFVRHYGFSWLSPFVFAGMRRFHNRGSATLVPTTQLGDFLESNGFRHVRLLRRAVDTQMFDPGRRCARLREDWGLAPDALAVVHVGRLAAEKNIDLAVRAFRRIQNVQPDARFIVVGDGPELPRLVRSHPDILFAGMRRGEDLAQHYASGDLFLFPSITETFGNVTLEAMASGLPVVAFDYGAAREHIADGESGRRVAFDDESSFIDAACTLASDRYMRRQLGQRARQSMEHLSADAVSAAFADLLGELALARAA